MNVGAVPTWRDVTSAVLMMVCMFGVSFGVAWLLR